MMHRSIMRVTIRLWRYSSVCFVILRKFKFLHCMSGSLLYLVHSAYSLLPIPGSLVLFVCLQTQCRSREILLYHPLLCLLHTVAPVSFSAWCLARASSLLSCPLFCPSPVLLRPQIMSSVKELLENVRILKKGLQSIARHELGDTGGFHPGEYQ